MAAYDISASASTSSSAATGATKFGNITSGSIGVPSWVLFAVAGAVLAMFGGYFFFIRKAK